MAPIGFALCPKTSIFFPSSNVEERVSGNYLYANKHISKTGVIASYGGSKLMAQSTVTTTSSTSVSTSSRSSERTNFGFKNLAETFWVDVQRAEGRPLNLELIAPLSVGSKSVEEVENVAIRVELTNGCVGWGEVPVFPSVTAVNHTVALAKAMEACEFLSCSSPMVLSLVLSEIGGILPGPELASVRAGVEMALIDAVANSIDVPLWRLFGGVANTLTTGVTLPTVFPAEAYSQGASKYCQSGFRTFKLKIGKNTSAEIKALQAIQAAHPLCSLILDANEAYTCQEAIEILQKLYDSGITPAVLEQPVHRSDWKGLGEVSNFAREKKYGISVAVDETCQSLIEVRRVIKENLADAINIKLAKFGVMGALEIIELARESGVKLMISGTVESRLATGFAAHLAAGLGCFKSVVLDMPFLLSEDPVICGYEASGPVYKFLNVRGQGGFLKWDFSS
ncbi:L-Ala-D/L-amino acid epimerase [Ricinus communis]|nr:L-Ala-D/L-amino acid epimerase [Ricinus communis]|eukprot:XP_002528080.2 L-Ala-D/L-amino acid epimerase isoform X2 [Ricinus communis]